MREDFSEQETVNNPAKTMRANALNPCFLYIVVQISYLFKLGLVVFIVRFVSFFKKIRQM